MQSRRLVVVLAKALASVALMAAACGGNPGQSGFDVLLGDTADGPGIDGGPDTGPTPDNGLPPADLPPVDVTLPFTPTGVETSAPAQVRVGDMVPVTCLLIDATGETNMPPQGVAQEIRVSPEGSVMRQGSMLIAIRTGQIEVACSFPSLSLVDLTPALVEVLGGPPATVTTAVDTTSVTAGGTVTAACLVYDAYGNLVTDVTPAVSVTPSDTGNTTDGNTTTFTHAGRYTVACTLEGAESHGVEIEVLPGLPAQLVVAKAPDEAVYFVGQNVEVTHTVLDQYGNTIPDARVTKSSANVNGSGPTSRIGLDRFSYGGDGLYRVTATVDGPTEGGVVLTASVDILVNSNGPDIRCDSPGDGSVMVVAPGAPVTFHGSVSDVNGVADMQVNGSSVNVAGDGSFQVDITSRYGINFIDLIATDVGGVQNSRTCAFLVADRFVDEGGLLANSVMLRLAQAAIDDTSRAGAIGSLGDILHTVLNSQGLKDTLHNALLAANPLKPSSCDQQVCVFGACACVLSSQITYISSSLPGPNTTALTLVNGGLMARIRFEDPRIRLRANGRAAGIGYDTSGDVNIDFIEVDVTFDLGVDGAGRPNISIRANSVAVRVGSISTNFSGIDGFIVNIAVALANGTVRDLVANTLRNFVTNNFNSILDGLVSGLDISSLGTSFNVPRLDGSGNIRLNFGLGFSSIGANTTRALFGIGTRFTTNAAAHSRPPLRAPLPPFDTFIDPNAGGRPVAVAVHVGVFQQALQALWRAGLFDANLGAALGGGSDGITGTLVTGLPPVVFIRSGTTVGLDLGAMQLNLTVPGVIDNLAVTLGIRASTTVSLSGDDLAFGAVTIDELFFSTGSVSLSQSTRDTLENFFRRLMQSVVGGALNGALPALPIPSFPVPASLTQFGLPAGGELGITGPTLNSINPHFVLRGNFGIR